MNFMRSMTGQSTILFSITLALIFSANRLQAQTQFRGDFAPGDGVRIIVWQDPTNADVSIKQLGIERDYIIDRTGRILLPLIGEVTVVGKSKSQLAETLSERYRQYISGLYFVCLPLIRITVLGAVNQPGSYLIERENSLWQLIDKAGGPRPEANLEKIYLTRGGKIAAEGLLEVYEKAYSLAEIKVRSGDQVMVPFHSGLTVRDVMRYASFLMSGVSLYLQIRRATQ